jgi:hypothetical protein
MNIQEFPDFELFDHTRDRRPIEKHAVFSLNSSGLCASRCLMRGDRGSDRAHRRDGCSWQALLWRDPLPRRSIARRVSRVPTG